MAAYFNSDVNGKLATPYLHILASPAIFTFKMKATIIIITIYLNHYKLAKSVLVNLSSHNS